jgi:uncharacterized protein
MPSQGLPLLELLDWRRTIAELYARIRARPDPEVAWGEWRTTRDRLFAEHPQSPIPARDRATFAGLSYAPYDPSFRVLATLEPAPSERLDIGTSTGGSTAFTRFATARFELGGAERALQVYWLEGYGGGLFVSFRDTTSGRESYGAGRYLLDTVKGADLGSDGDRVVFDLNFSYNPSCAYDPRWSCPLAPPDNRLATPVRAGELAPVRP